MLGPQETSSTVVQIIGLLVILIAYLATRSKSH